MINKNISIWRGSATPPTNYHLWEKEDGGLYVYLDKKWQHLIAPNDKTILDEHLQQLNKIKDLAITEVAPTNTNTYKSYLLKSGNNVFGTTIDIPKDKFIKLVTLGYDNATIDTSTGNINIGTGLAKEYLLFSITLDTGNYELISINLSEFITEKDYSDGLEVVNNKLKVKVDPNSEEYLKVTNNGVKVEGINTKVSGTVDDIKTKILNGEWLPLKQGRNSDGTLVPNSIAMGYNSEATMETSVAIGYECKATGVDSHAEGHSTIASGDNSHSEGYLTGAIGDTSHAEGQSTEAEGTCSHAEGEYTIAQGYCSHVQGCNNYSNKHFIDTVGIGYDYGHNLNASIIYVGRTNFGRVDPNDPKTGYQYLLGVGGYQGQEIGNAKSVQEVFADLKNNKVNKTDMITITNEEIDEMFNK